MSQKHTMPQLFNKISLQNYLQPMNETILKNKLRKILESHRNMYDYGSMDNARLEIIELFSAALKKKEEEVYQAFLIICRKAVAAEDENTLFIKLGKKDFEKLEAKYLKRE